VIPNQEEAELARLEPAETAELAHAVIDAIADKQGEDIVLLDIRPVSLLADYFIICSAQSDRQIRAIVDSVLARMNDVDMRPIHTEGVPASGWVIVDFGPMVVHIFDPDARAYYQLERLWEGATLVIRMK
jgi:ribosome-associated protein